MTDNTSITVLEKHDLTRVHEWDEPVWRRPLPAGELDAELQTEIVRALDRL